MVLGKNIIFVFHLPHRLAQIVAQVALPKKSAFISQLQSYWLLKRQSRNGVPILRRLQANTGTGINRNQREEQVCVLVHSTRKFKFQCFY